MASSEDVSIVIMLPVCYAQTLQNIEITFYQHSQLHINFFNNFPGPISFELV